jgi:hypothetical protein
MKKIRILLPMILCAMLMRAASFASESVQTSEQTSAQKQEKSANASPLNRNENNQVSGEKELANGHSVPNYETSAGESKSSIKHHSATAQVKPAPSHQVRSGKAPTNENLRTSAPADTMDFHPASPSLLPGIPNKAGIHRNTQVASSTTLSAAALNGQQFKNSRDPGARLASSGGPAIGQSSIGGPATSRRGTAGINGSEMKRKP